MKPIIGFLIIPDHEAIFSWGKRGIGGVPLACHDITLGNLTQIEESHLVS